MENNRMFHEISAMLGLGKLRAEPKSLSGGFMHRMYSLETETGKYAVKLLNPYIMKRDTAMDNYRQAERLEAKLEKQGLPILPALIFDGRKMQEHNGRYFYIFDWFEGKALTGEEIRKEHCEKMGSILAEIHRIDVQRERAETDENHGDWAFYERLLREENRELAGLLEENSELLTDCQARGNKALKRIPDVVTVCHNDMDSKNVLWKGTEFRVIDLECLSYGSPYMEMYNLALNWAGCEECRIDFEKLRALVEAYRDAGGLMPEDWESLYDCEIVGRLDWLEYNLKRTLGIEGGSDEKELGAVMVKWAVEHLRYYAASREAILQCVKGIKFR